ncbi:hypothetical protein EOM82_08580 [bacterium]|nr:hypothetical protein [bacterium]
MGLTARGPKVCGYSYNPESEIGGHGVNTWKKTIWKVPLFCVIAGIIDFYVSVRMLSWAIIRLPDGTVTIDDTRSLMVFGVIFLATFLAGGLIFFRKMTRREIFYSASVLAVYGIVLMLVQYGFNLTTGPAAVWMMYLFYPFEVFTFISQLLIKFAANLWIGAAIQALAPYLFVLFGKSGVKGKLKD